MNKELDFVQSADGDIAWNGDFQFGDQANRLVKVALLSSPGQWRVAPQVGGEIELLLNGSVSDEVLNRKIATTLAIAKLQNRKVRISRNGLQNYKIDIE